MESKYKVTYKIPNQENTTADLSEVEPYRYGKTSSKHDKARQKWWTRVILTGLSAIAIGTIFGLLLLTIFSNDNDVLVSGDNNETPTSKVPSDATPSGEVSTVELRPLSGHVIQAGAFQSSEQAKLSQDAIINQGLKSIIWKTESDERVFIAIYQSKEDADLVGEQIDQAGVENYVREWESKRHSLELTQMQHDWLLDFQALWKDSSTNFSTEIEQAWDAWLEVDLEDLSQELQSFYQTVQITIKELTVKQIPYQLLVLLADYDNL